MIKSNKFRGRIFISYRREETAYAAEWLFASLTERFGSGRVFKDIHEIRPGDNFVLAINQAVGSCDVLLAVIGKQWLTIRGENKKRRLDNPADLVRIEIEAAMTRNIRVIPILVDKATMPRAIDLPGSLADFAHRHAIELSPDQMNYGINQLIEVLNTLDTKPRVDPSKSKAWQAELISRSRLEVAFRLYSGSRQHFIKLRRVGFSSDVLYVDGKPVTDKETKSVIVQETIPIVDEYGRIVVTFTLARNLALTLAELVLRVGTVGTISSIGPVWIAVDGVLVYEDSGEAITEFGKAIARRVPGRIRKHRRSADQPADEASP